MIDNALHTVEAQIREQAAAYCESDHVPGFVAGVYHAGDQVVVAHATGAPMLDDTGFLLGSVTKVLTTTLLPGHGALEAPSGTCRCGTGRSTSLCR